MPIIQSQQERMISEANASDGFNEKIVKLLSLNQAISKIVGEVNNLIGIRDHIIKSMED